MALAMTPIRTAIREVLEGTIGSVRTVPVGTFSRGAQDGRSVTSRQAQTLINPRYDVRLDRMTQHPATPVGAIGSYRLDELAVTVLIAWKLSSTILDDQRDAVRNDVMDALDTAWQALARPGNLDQTAGAVSTNIISGCLIGLEAMEIIEENWDEHQLAAQISATCIVKVTQAVA